jgi:hypothetical protein
VRKIFTRLGSLTYDLHSSGEKEFFGRDEVKGLIAQIEVCKIRVREIETEIEAIRQEERRKPSGPQEYQPMV